MDLDIYAEELIYAYEHPQHKGQIKDANIRMHEENTSCGDSMDVYLKMENGKLKDVKFDGSGCVISMGSAELLLDSIRGKNLAEIEKMDKERLLKLISIDPGPVRLHCATLSLRAIKKAVYEFEKKPIDASVKEL